MKNTMLKITITTLAMLLVTTAWACKKSVATGWCSIAYGDGNNTTLGSGSVYQGSDFSVPCATMQTNTIELELGIDNLAEAVCEAAELDWPACLGLVVLSAVVDHVKDVQEVTYAIPVTIQITPIVTINSVLTHTWDCQDATQGFAQCKTIKFACRSNVTYYDCNNLPVTKTITSRYVNFPIADRHSTDDECTGG